MAHAALRGDAEKPMKASKASRKSRPDRYARLNDREAPDPHNLSHAARGSMTAEN